MAAPVWTIKINGGTAQTLAALGVSKCAVSFRSLAADVLSIACEGRAADAEPVFAYGDTVQLYKDATQWFVGTCKTLARQGAATTEGHEYEIAGPWWQLERQPYFIAWQKYYGATTPVRDSFLIPDILLNLDASGNPTQTDTQIADAISFAAGCGVAVQNGTGYPQMWVFVEEVRDIMCAEVIIRQCRFCPDAVSWFDYSTTPPTFHLKRGSALTPTTLPLWNLTNHESIAITRRDDLVVTEVCLYYQRIDQLDGKPCGRLFTDFYTTRDTTGSNPPIGRGTRPVVGTIELAPYETTYARSTVEGLLCNAQSGTEATRIDWWKIKEPLLNSPYIKTTSLHVTSATVTDDTGATVNLATYPYEVQNTVPKWVLVGGVPAVTVEATVKMEARFEIYLDTDHKLLYQQPQRKEYSCRIKLTNCPPGEYSTVDSRTPGEDPPAGMAQSVFNSLSTAQYEGQVRYAQSDVTALIRPSATLNLSGGRAEWASMAALVQGVTEDIVNGFTVVHFGPMPRFTLDQLIELYKATRNRRQWTNPLLRTTGELGTSAVSSQVAAARENTTGLPAHNLYSAVMTEFSGGSATRVKADATNGQHVLEKVDADGTPIAGQAQAIQKLDDAAGKEIKFRARGTGIVYCSDDFLPVAWGGEWQPSTAYSRGTMVTINTGTAGDGTWVSDYDVPDTVASPSTAPIEPVSGKPYWHLLPTSAPA